MKRPTLMRMVVVVVEVKEKEDWRDLVSVRDDDRFMTFPVLSTFSLNLPSVLPGKQANVTCPLVCDGRLFGGVSFLGTLVRL